MKGIERVERQIAHVIGHSPVPEDPGHSGNTLEWLLQFDPKADAALRIAALGHDIERAIEGRKVCRGDFPTYDAFKAAHARNSARILMEILKECGVEDEPFSREVCRLVRRHEVGGGSALGSARGCGQHFLLRRESPPLLRTEHLGGDAAALYLGLPAPIRARKADRNRHPAAKRGAFASDGGVHRGGQDLPGKAGPIQAAAFIPSRCGAACQGCRRFPLIIHDG